MLHRSFVLPDLELPEDDEEDKEDIMITDFGKLLSNQENNDEKVLLYSKLGTLNFDTMSGDESVIKAESEQNNSEMIENMKSI